MSIIKRIRQAALVTLGLTAIGVGATAGISAAHTPEVTSTCTRLEISLDHYEAGPGNNLITVTVATPGAADFTVDFPFASSHVTEHVNWSQTQEHTWTVVIDANRVTGNPTQFDRTFTGTQQPCQPTTTTTAVITTTSPATTTTQPQHIPVSLCHQEGNGSYQLITIDDDGQDFHGHGHHTGDIIPAPGGGCPVTTTSTAPPTTEPETTVPETTIPVVDSTVPVPEATHMVPFDCNGFTVHLVNYHSDAKLTVKMNHMTVIDAQPIDTLSYTVTYSRALWAHYTNFEVSVAAESGSFDTGLVDLAWCDATKDSLPNIVPTTAGDTTPSMVTDAPTTTTVQPTTTVLPIATSSTTPTVPAAIVSQSTQPPTQRAGTLPQTGGTPIPQLIVAGIALLAGVGFVAAARRRNALS